ncbi:MAG: phosphoribosylformylglycinamidine synthase subunit PurQ [Calditrichaeota bacterium]|nr:phosphoribosylformylglycinamidine synthase subunit PurQ [Calditrichota bacterium]
MKIAVIVFPGSNCDHDAEHAFGTVLSEEVEMIWHKEDSLNNADLVFIPGGFSYGDYLRCGAIARFSPIMKEVVNFAKNGGPVIGVCNGFQVLTESHLLPGALVRNSNLAFVCETTILKAEKSRFEYTAKLDQNHLLRVPIAHGEGRYIADADVLKEIEDNQQVVFRYVDMNGKATLAANPNGSLNNIAGICNKAGNVLGMMPHPERAVEPELGSEDGLLILKSIVEKGLEVLA